VPNVIKNGKAAVEILQIFRFSRWQPEVILDFQITEISMAASVWRVRCVTVLNFAMESLHNGTRSDSLASIRYSYLCKKVTQQKHLLHQSDCPQLTLQQYIMQDELSFSRGMDGL